MKKVFLVLLLALLLAPPPFQATAQEANPDGASLRTIPPAGRAESYPDSEDDIFSSSFEREMLTRRFFQKTLPPLKPREKVAWAFRTSRASILL
ncbi:MAG TPA: hypothetical protein PK919_02625 [Candidatus Aminicenantes bacterium]|nr:hypothetical protein [Candidatus Aminicenantes bacterium]